MELNAEWTLCIASAVNGEIFLALKTNIGEHDIKFDLYLLSSFPINRQIEILNEEVNLLKQQL
jgi:hypothetical protein